MEMTEELNIKNQIQTILNNTGIFCINEEEDLNLDSLHFISLLCELEEAFDIEIPADITTSNNLHTFGDFCNLVLTLKEEEDQNGI